MTPGPFLNPAETAGRINAAAETDEAWRLVEDEIYFLCSETLKSFLAKDLWEEAVRWFGGLRFSAANALLWRMFQCECGPLKDFAAIYLVKMRSSPEYHQRRGSKLLAGVDPRLVQRLLPAVYKDLKRVEQKGWPSPGPLSFSIPKIKALALPSIDPVRAAETLRSNAAFFGPTIAPEGEVAMALDQNLAEYLPPLLRSVMSHSGLKLRFHIMIRGLGSAYAASVAARFPGASFSFYFCDDFKFEGTPQLLSYTTAATLDRLLLPFLLNESARVLYLDIDTLAVADLDFLFKLDLGKNLLAAFREHYERLENGVFHGCDRQEGILKHRLWPLSPYEAQRRRVFLRKVFNNWDHFYFNAGVMVMNLALWRETALATAAISLVENFQFHDQDALNLCAGGRVLELPGEWNFMNTIYYTESPRIIHWAGQFKPWGAFYVPHQERWRRCLAEA